MKELIYAGTNLFLNVKDFDREKGKSEGILVVTVFLL